MASLLRFLTLAAFVSAVSGYALLGEFPTQTVGYGSPFMQQPTEAPSMELVKKNLKKKALTNTCTEWSIEGGLGQPICTDSATCLFQTIDGYFYEGCGETSITYDWVTACYDYPISGTAPVSEIYCDESAPYCGYLAFQFGSQGNDETFTNFGCSTTAYELYADLIVDLNSDTSTSVTLAAGGTTQLTITGASPDTTSTAEPTQTQGSGGSSPQPPIGSHRRKKKTPVGAIAGGVVGGILVLAVIAFLIFFFIRKRRDSRGAAEIHSAPTQEQQQQPGMAQNTAAYQGTNEVKPGPDPAYAGAFAPQQQNVNEKLNNGQPSPNPQTPLPMYSQPQQQAYGQHNQQYSQQSPNSQFSQPTAPNSYIQQTPNSQFSQPSAPNSPPPPSNYSELDTNNNQNLQPGSHASVGPVSPVGTFNSNASELGGSTVSNPRTYQPPNPLQEVPANMAEMSGNAATRPPRQSAGFDMNGAPLSETYGSHELP